MNDVAYVKQLKEIVEIALVPKRKNTKLIRTISAKEFGDIKKKTIDNVFNICELLLEERKWELGVIAYDWAFRMKTKYDKEQKIVLMKT